MDRVSLRHAMAWAAPVATPVCAILAYGTVLAVTLVTITAGVGRLAETLLLANHIALKPAPTSNKPNSIAAITVRTGHWVPTADDAWAEQLRNPAYWAKRRTDSGNAKWLAPAAPPRWNEQRFGLGVYQPTTRDPLAIGLVPRDAPPPRRSRGEDDDQTFRTVCVRLCDGSFTPLSFATTRENFEADATRCEKSCSGGGARMFFHQNPGSQMDAMEDMNGQPYKKLATAFLYKTTYDASCKCRPHPWEEAAQTKHKIYALEAQRAKGNKLAGRELDDLKAQQKQADAAAAAQKAADLVTQRKQAKEARDAKANARVATATDGSKRARAPEPAPRAPTIIASAQGILPMSGAPSTLKMSSAAPTPMQGAVIMRLGTATVMVRPPKQSRPTRAIELR